jgi:hypothetical protein
MEVLIRAFSLLAGSRNQLRRLGFSRLPCKASPSRTGWCERRYDPTEQNTNTCNRPQGILHRPKYIPTAQTIANGSDASSDCSSSLSRRFAAVGNRTLKHQGPTHPGRPSFVSDLDGLPTPPSPDAPASAPRSTPAPPPTSSSSVCPPRHMTGRLPAPLPARRDP